MAVPQRKHNRLQGYDYSQNGYYFVTICTQNRREFFGKVVEDKMVLNEYGKIVERCWLEIPNHFPNVDLDEFVIMPNHIHGIVIVDVLYNVGIADLRSLPDRTKMILSKAVHGFKSTASRIIHDTLTTDFHWQRSFYDEIIRNETALQKIREYIQNNPLQWALDKDNPKNLRVTL